MVADSSDNNPKSNGGAEKKKERTACQFFHIGKQGEQGDASAKVGAELHPLDSWVAGAGRAAFKGADGRSVVLHDVLFVPDLKANLISLRKLAKAGVSTSTDGALMYKGQAGEGSASQGECNAVGGVGVKVSARSGEIDWATAQRRLGHVAMPLLKQLEKDGVVKGLKLNGQPPDDNCEICLLSKFTRFPFHSVTGRCKKPLELVHMDLVGPLPVQGHKGERYFLTIVDDWSRLMWAYPLKQKNHAAPTIKKDWLPFVEKQAECVVKRIRTDRGGKFLGAEMTAWLKKQGIQRELTTAYSPQSNGVAERANRTILETARALLIESGVGNSMWPHAVRHATIARNRVLTKVGNESTSSCDESIFLKGEGEKLVLFLVYVDEILLFSSSMKEIQKVQQQLMKNFKCKTLGEVKYYLGMHVERDLDHRWLKLHQEKFIKELGEKYGIEN
ncbi:unnamed protein product [Closterium sp. NIES-54]